MTTAAGLTLRVHGKRPMVSVKTASVVLVALAPWHVSEEDNLRPASLGSEGQGLPRLEGGTRD